MLDNDSSPPASHDSNMMQFIDFDNELNDKSHDATPLDLSPMSGLEPELDMRCDMSSFFDAQIKSEEPAKSTLERWKDRITAAVTPGFPPLMNLNSPDRSDLKLETTPNDTDIDTTGFGHSYRQAHALLKDTKFGRAVPSQPTDITSEYQNTGITNWNEFLQNHAKTNYKYQLHLDDFPRKSRVETQIKCRIIFSPAPKEHLLHLPTDTMARPRFQLTEAFTANKDMIDLSVDVVIPSKPQKNLFMCNKCTNRERRRAFRKKNLDTNEGNHWIDGNKRVSVLNCREIVSFSLAKSCEVDGTIVHGRYVELPLRIACYSRHHPAKEGFRVIFTARDHTGEVVGRAISDSIFITDDHKDTRSGSSVVQSSNGYSASGANTGPPSPVSMEESSDVSSSTSYKRRRQDNDWEVQKNLQNQYRTHDLGSPSSSDGGLNHWSPKSTNMNNSAQPTNSPTIMRVIPSQGSVRGGIEVTLLGSGFQNGMVTTFGGVKSASTHCWNDSTMVTQLPPASSAGPVLVAFDGYPNNSSQMFTYVDDTDRQLIELALQVVGMKMNGRLDNARNVAMQIVGSGGPDGLTNAENGNNRSSTGTATSSPEETILRCISIVDGQSGSLPNWQLRNTEGQTMMHLAAILGYGRVISSLLGKGARIDIQDLNGLAPLHFAVLYSQKHIVLKLLKHRADPCQTCNVGRTARNYASDPEIIDVLDDWFDENSEESFGHSLSRRRSSLSTTASSTNTSNVSSRSGSRQGSLLGESNGYTDSGEFDFESGNDDDLLWENDSSERTSGDDESSAAPRIFTHYEGQNVPPRVKNPDHPDGFSGMLQQLTAQARNHIHWDNWDVHQLIGNGGKLRASRSSVLKYDAVTGSSNSESDATVTGSMTRVWNYLTQPEISAPRFHPPSYDEIFPNISKSGNSDVKAAPTQGFGQQNTIDGEQGEEGEEDIEKKFVQTWMTNRKQLKNDKMLFFFWLPALLLAIVYVAQVLSYEPMTKPNLAAITDLGGSTDWRESIRHQVGQFIRIGYGSTNNAG